MKAAVSGLAQVGICGLSRPLLQQSQCRHPLPLSKRSTAIFRPHSPSSPLPLAFSPSPPSHPPSCRFSSPSSSHPLRSRSHSFLHHRPPLDSSYIDFSEHGYSIVIRVPGFKTPPLDTTLPRTSSLHKSGPQCHVNSLKLLQLYCRFSPQWVNVCIPLVFIIFFFF